MPYSYRQVNEEDRQRQLEILEKAHGFRRETYGYPWPPHEVDYDCIRNIIKEELQNVLIKKKPHPLEPLPGELDRLKAEFDKRKEYGL